MDNSIFSWAENVEGRIVHVDSVNQGLSCGCTCPYCHERVIARHGEIMAHGFAHHSFRRGANLRICYLVTMYKLAEQIVKDSKKIFAPSYYGIFKSSILQFSDVKIDNRYDREDKQPDVIATSITGEQYLIEFKFSNIVKRSTTIDYTHLNCIEIDLSAQTLESLPDFLLNSSDSRRWLNNPNYFERIESTYQSLGKIVRLKSQTECILCPLGDDCCGVLSRGTSSPLIIENNGTQYRLCKTEEFNKKICQLEEEKLKRQEEERLENIRNQERLRKRREQDDLDYMRTSLIDADIRSCFMCKSNLDWACGKDGYARCGAYMSMCVSKYTLPETAKYCKGFRMKDT